MKVAVIADIPTYVFQRRPKLMRISFYKDTLASKKGKAILGLLSFSDQWAIPVQVE